MKSLLLAALLLITTIWVDSAYAKSDVVPASVSNRKRSVIKKGLTFKLKRGWNVDYEKRGSSTPGQLDLFTPIQQDLTLANKITTQGTLLLSIPDRGAEE